MIVKHLTTLEELVKYSRFIRKGYDALVENGNMSETWDQFMRLISLTAFSDNGFVGMLMQPSGKALGFIVVLDNSHEIIGKSAFVYSIYTTGEHRDTVKLLEQECIEWCRPRGIKTLQAATRRINGAAFRWFERKLNWTRDMLIFKKEVV